MNVWSSKPLHNMVLLKDSEDFTFKLMTKCESTIIQMLRCTCLWLAIAKEGFFFHSFMTKLLVTNELERIQKEVVVA